MNNKLVLVIVGVLGVVVIGVGLGLLLTRPSGFTPPGGQPVLYAQELYTMQGIDNSLYLYEDGTVVYITETGLRVPTADHPAIRTWYKAALTPTELADLLGYFREIDFNALEIPPFWNGQGEHPVPSSDLMYTVSVSSGDLQRTLLVQEYFPPTRTDQTAIMPAPMDSVYSRLAAITAGTTEFRTEEISD
jgi:hypothetical protein